MRTLKRNLQPFYYAKYLGKTAVVDDDGYETGEYKPTYGTKTLAYANIGRARGDIYSAWYGIAQEYDKTLLFDKNVPISETTRLWIDDFECTDGDYAVKLISKTLNHTQVLVSKVKI